MPSLHEVRMTQLDTNPVFQCLRAIIFNKIFDEIDWEKKEPFQQYYQPHEIIKKCPPLIVSYHAYITIGKTQKSIIYILEILKNHKVLDG